MQATMQYLQSLSFLEPLRSAISTATGNSRSDPELPRVASNVFSDELQKSSNVIVDDSSSEEEVNSRVQPYTGHSWQAISKRGLSNPSCIVPSEDRRKLYCCICSEPEPKDTFAKLVNIVTRYISDKPKPPNKKIRIASSRKSTVVQPLVDASGVYCPFCQQFVCGHCYESHHGVVARTCRTQSGHICPDHELSLSAAPLPGMVCGSCRTAELPIGDLCIRCLWCQRACCLQCFRAVTDCQPASGSIGWDLFGPYTCDLGRLAKKGVILDPKYVTTPTTTTTSSRASSSNLISDRSFVSGDPALLVLVDLIPHTEASHSSMMDWLCLMYHILNPMQIVTLPVDGIDSSLDENCLGEIEHALQPWRDGALNAILVISEHPFIATAAAVVVEQSNLKCPVCLLDLQSLNSVPHGLDSVRQTLLRGADTTGASDSGLWHLIVRSHGSELAEGFLAFNASLTSLTELTVTVGNSSNTVVCCTSAILLQIDGPSRELWLLSPMNGRNKRLLSTKYDVAIKARCTSSKPLTVDGRCFPLDDQLEKIYDVEISLNYHSTVSLYRYHDR